jgi:hypothetical protein
MSRLQPEDGGEGEWTIGLEVRCPSLFAARRKTNCLSLTVFGAQLERAGTSQSSRPRENKYFRLARGLHLMCALC